MGKSQTFLSEEEKTPRGLIRHLRIVITDPDENGDHLVVSVTSWREGARSQDDSCILPAGCHPFIKHKSWVDFTRTRCMNFTDIYNGLQKGFLLAKEDMPTSVIQDIQGAASISEYIPDELIRFFDFF